jgi:hypothetical protein
MPGPLDRQDDAAVWRRWRSASAMGVAPSEPDALALAAYAEGRLTETDAEAIEDWLALNPAAIEDVLLARRAEEGPVPVAPEAIMTRAAALVGERSAQVLAFRRLTPSRRSWSSAARWSAMAASILVACFVGVAMGDATYAVLASGSTLGQDLIDPPMGFLSTFDEDSST